MYFGLQRITEGSLKLLLATVVLLSMAVSTFTAIR